MAGWPNARPVIFTDVLKDVDFVFITSEHLEGFIRAEHMQENECRVVHQIFKRLAHL